MQKERARGNIELQLPLANGKAKTSTIEPSVSSTLSMSKLCKYMRYILRTNTTARILYLHQKSNRGCKALVFRNHISKFNKTSCPITNPYLKKIKANQVSYKLSINFDEAIRIS
jgi:hypothetical protein